MSHSNSVNKWKLVASFSVLECCFVCTHLAASQLVRKLHKYLIKKKKKRHAKHSCSYAHLMYTHTFLPANECVPVGRWPQHLIPVWSNLCSHVRVMHDVFPRSLVMLHCHLSSELSTSYFYALFSSTLRRVTMPKVFGVWKIADCRVGVLFPCYAKYKCMLCWWGSPFVSGLSQLNCRLICAPISYRRSILRVNFIDIMLGSVPGCLTSVNKFFAAL